MWKMLVEEFFQKYINSQDVVLDMPCGYGEFINNVKAKKKLALDINPDSNQYLAKDVKFLHASSTAIPLRSKTVDKVFISNFFEHISRDDILKTIKELSRILKIGGKVIILQPNIRFCAKDYWMFFDHITPVDDRALTEVFIANNFKIVKKILRFLPYSSRSKFPQTWLLIKIYINYPLLWKIFGKQSLLIYQKY